ncbi:MAG: GDP-mannose 4,6-dehydratase, partial [Firmicutes bacterium]|nr:GDP-mannose 4,6-dehydratase [Bacillota bacterium]
RALDYKPRLLLIGSAEEYGRAEPGDRPIDEQTVPRPGNIYAATKTCQNMLGKIYADAYGLDVLMVRAFNHVGPGQPFGFVVPDFCRQIVEIEIGKREPVVKVGNLSARRDFTDVRDVVRAYSLLIERGQAGETYNIGSGHAVEMRAILEKLLALSPAKITVEADPQKFRPVDVPVVEAVITKLHELTRWRPQILLEQTLADTLGYWRAKIKAETV